MAEIDEAILGSVANGNMKTIGDASAFYTAQIMQTAALAAQNAVADSQRMNSMANQAAGMVLNKMTTLDPAEAIAISKAVPSDLAAQLAQLLSAVSAGQQLSKTADNTPPVTP